MEKSQLSINYYFNNINDFILPQVFEAKSYPWETLINAKKIIDKLVLENKMSIKSPINSKSTIKGYVCIGNNTTIEENVTIEGPVIIGDNCTIKQGALIRGGSIISDNCTVGHGSEIKNSLILKDAKISSLVFVGDSIIGKGSRIGSGTITANRRFDQKNIGTKFENNYYEFQTDFFGCILGDYSRVGANCTTLPGTFIGPYTWIMPHVRVGSFIPSEKIVDNEQKIFLKDNNKLILKN